MKRSEINRAILWAKALLREHGIRLPGYAYWEMDKWKREWDRCETIERAMLGWDVSDFGSGDFSTLGAVLYTVRNGCAQDGSIGVPYCEKYILMREGQRMPKHFHRSKTEDIINRAGGVLTVYLWNTDAKGNALDTDVRVLMDGMASTFVAGEAIDVHPGNSVSIQPHVAHIFGPKRGCGDLVAGEVSKVNDDNTDNAFLETVSRFAEIEEDEAPLHPLCNEYARLLGRDG